LKRIYRNHQLNLFQIQLTHGQEAEKKMRHGQSL